MKKTDHIVAGAQLGPYVLKEPIGKGASATVWRAEDADGEQLAVKIRRRGQAAMDRRFLREFESMRLLRVPGVVRVHQAGLDDDVLWFSMELVSGRPFPEVVRAHHDPAERVAKLLELAGQLFRILSALHEAGFVHRDIKPSNVLVDTADKVQVLDFGIGRFYAESDTTLSHSGEVLGTVPFMAPEQIAGLPLSSQVDMFASGLMLYEAIGGKRPRPSTTVGWIPILCLERLVPLACRMREVPLGLSKLVERLTAVEPSDRPSARQAQIWVRDLVLGKQPPEWPEPRFVATESWWHPAEGVLGFPNQPAIWILEGPTGSGRRRVAEHLHRLGLMQGVWPIHLHCRVDQVGAPMAQLLEHILQGFDDEKVQREIVSEDRDALRRMWPHLPIPGAIHASELPTSTELADAVGNSVQRASTQRPLMVILHQVDQIDALTARVLLRIALHSGRLLGLLLLHDPNRSTRTSQMLVSHLQARHGGESLEVPPLSPDQATEIAQELCPNQPPTQVIALRPQLAVEVGLQALARWRGESWRPPAEALWPLAVRQAPVPADVLNALAGPEALSSPWVRLTDHGYALDGNTAWRAASYRLQAPHKAARQLAAQFTRARSPRHSDLASLWLLAGDPLQAWFPAAQAALEQERLGNYHQARRWLLVLDTLPTDRSSASQVAFELAWARARVALRTEAGPPRIELVDVCEGLARTEDQAQIGRILRVQYQVRSGQVRAALVAALRLSSPAKQPSPTAAVLALLIAITCRTSLGQLEDARRELARARRILDRHPDPIYDVQIDNWHAEIAFQNLELEVSRRLCQRVIVEAARVGRIRGVAFAASRLGKVLRMLGRRREAEHQTRSARQAFTATGDLALDAETGLALATLLVERGDAVGARQLLDDTIRRIRSMNLDQLLPSALRVTLQTAILRGDPSDANLALSELDVSSDPEAPAAITRWWRSRRDLDRALRVPGPPPKRYYGHALWRLERARAAIVGGAHEIAEAEASAALEEAGWYGFAELEIYARMLLGVVQDTPDAEWKQTLAEASSCQSAELFLGSLEMHARRLHRRGDSAGAHAQWRTLHARARELGYRPSVDEAEGWIS